MKFKVATDDLKLALSKAKTTISCKDVKPLLRNFYLSVEGGFLSIMATDMDLGSICKIAVTDFEKGVTTVPGEKLFSIVDFAESPEVEFTLSEDKAEIVCGNFTASLPCLSGEDFPTVQDFDSDKFYKIGREVFLENLNRISFSISDNEARKNLLAVYLNGGFIQASDGHVSSLCKFTESINDTLIPSLAIPDLVRVLKASDAKDVEITSSESFLLFRLGSDVFVSRLSQAKFPNIPDRILKPTEKNAISVEFSKKELLNAVRRVSVTSNVNSFAIKFIITKDSTRLESSDLSGNTSFEVIKSKASVDSLEFFVNYQYIEDICSSVYLDSFIMNLNDNIRIPIRIQEGHFTALLMRLSPKSASEADSE